jgi:hypothetical protein
MNQAGIEEHCGMFRVGKVEGRDLNDSTTVSQIDKNSTRLSQAAPAGLLVVLTSKTKLPSIVFSLYEPEQQRNGAYKSILITGSCVLLTCLHGGPICGRHLVLFLADRLDLEKVVVDAGGVLLQQPPQGHLLLDLHAQQDIEHSVRVKVLKSGDERLCSDLRKRGNSRL